jgi:hypothetical protein
MIARSNALSALSFRLGLSLTLSALPAVAALAADPAATVPEGQTLTEELGSGFYSRINLLGYGIYNDLDDAQEASNVLGIPRSQAEFDFRPDFGLNFRRVELGIKPRLQYARTKTDIGGGERRSDTAHHWFINEAYVRLRVSDQFLAIASRENLQWGPSALLSASNPFNANNGKTNPNIEQPGLDFVRLVFIPSSAFTVSLINNYAAGRLGKETTYNVTSPTTSQNGESPLDLSAQKPFRKTYAAKVDYTGDGHYFSVLMSHKQQDQNRLGFFGGWNASDALLLYAEGSAAKRADQPANSESERQLLGGAAYTLESGATITGEYFHNKNGCTLRPVALCLGANAPEIRYPLLRRRYALLQYADTKIGGNTNVVARVTRNLDDKSSQLTVNLEYELGDHWQLYLVPTLSSGSDTTEFGSLPPRSAFFGASYTF